MKFFRKIRQDLLSKGQTGKYLKYALGEIALVVIGILIAVQINIWNQRKQLKKEELKVLKNLEESIRINIEEFDYIFNAQALRGQSLQQALFTEIRDQKLVYLDSLVTANVQNHTFDPSSGIYNSMINSGSIGLISNNPLKNRISKLQDRVEDYQEVEDQITEYTKAHLESYFIDHYLIDPAVLAGLRKRTEEEERRDRASYIKVFESQKVKNMYILLLNKMGEVIKRGESLKAEYQGLVTDLENEIKSRQ